MARQSRLMSGRIVVKSGADLDLGDLQQAATKPVFQGFQTGGAGDSASIAALERLRGMAAQAHLEAVTQHLKA